jgi:serine phosphatase RsbU (regulator of sigma subunit)
MTSVDIEMLRSQPFLKHARPDVLESLVKMAAERRFEPGQIIFEEDSTGREMYLIIEGLVEVVKGHGVDEMVLATRGPGDLIGEMGLLESTPRFATLRVLESSFLLEFLEEDMRSVLAQQPLLLYRMVQELSSRLREADLQMIADLQRKNQELAQAYRELQAAQATLVEKERLERELELARQLQQSILPHEFPNLPGFSCTARSRPARVVGGDFYDVLHLPDGRLGLIVGDVAGKGMPAAFIMATTRSFLRATAQQWVSPGRVLEQVNDLLCPDMPHGMFVTCLCAVLDVGSGRLHYANAGQTLPYRLMDGRVIELEATGMPLGLVVGTRYDEKETTIAPGESLVCYTDGIVEAHNPQRQMFGFPRLEALVASHGGGPALIEFLLADLEAFTGTEWEQEDDVTLVVLQRGPD